MSDRNRQPDPEGLAIAKEASEAVHPATVILYGSRAAGDHRANSDVDLLIIAADHQEAEAANRALNQWIDSAKHSLDINWRTVTAGKFHNRRRLGQSLEGQAARHGFNVMGEKPEYGPEYGPPSEAIWEETRRWLENSEEHLQDYNEREDANHWNVKAMGYEAQQAVENAMKGLLQAHGDQRRFRRDLSRMWKYIEANIPWRTGSQGGHGKQAVRNLITHVTFQDSASGQTVNWLTSFAEGYPYEIVPRERTWEERKELQYLINQAVAALEDEALHSIGATRDSLFPKGKPWER